MYHLKRTPGQGFLCSVFCAGGLFERNLCAKLAEGIASVPGTRQIGTAEGKTGLVSFVMDCAHPQDIAMILDQQGVAVRTGHHCAQPLHERFGISVSARASLGVYNTEEDIEALVAALYKVRKFFG